MIYNRIQDIGDFIFVEAGIEKSDAIMVLCSYPEFNGALGCNKRML